MLFNPLNAELNPLCHFLALLAHHILYVSRIRVKKIYADYCEPHAKHRHVYRLHTASRCMQSQEFSALRVQIC